MPDEQEDNCRDIDDDIIHQVRRTGWFVVMVEATVYCPSFAYTIGLWKNYRHPEIISFGLTVGTLHSILNIAGDAIKAGATYVPGESYDDFFKNSKAHIITVDGRSLRDYFGYAIWFNEGADFPAVQLVWTDRSDKFPWEDGYEEEFKYRQPLLDRNADFKFREAKELAIFTTRQWLEQWKPILRVVHDEEGDWQFLTGDQMPDDIRLVCLDQIVKSDTTLNDLFNLNPGEQAERENIDSEWVRSKANRYEDDE